MARGERVTVVLNFPQTDARRLILKQVDCQGRSVKAIIDTGSGASLISPNFCRALGIEQYREWQGPRLLLMDGKTLVPSGMVKLKIYVEGRLIWVTAAVSEMNGFDLLLGNDALSQLGCFSVQYNDAGVGSFSSTTTTREENLRGKTGYIVNSETLSIPAFSMMYVNVVVPTLDGKNLGHMVESSPKVMTDKRVSIGRLLLPSRVVGGTHRFPLTNFSSSTQFIPAGMVVGKIQSVNQVLDENPEVGSDPVPTEPSLPFASRINKDLGNEDRERTIALLNRYLRCFAASPHELGRSNVVKHFIDTGNHMPVHQAPYASA